jgi:hypothetical protein
VEGEVQLTDCGLPAPPLRCSVESRTAPAFLTLRFFYSRPLKQNAAARAHEHPLFGEVRRGPARLEIVIPNTAASRKQQRRCEETPDADLSRH